jgi:hypothetical protein
MNDLIEKIIKTKIHELLVVIQNNYPDQIKKGDITKEFDYIWSKINLKYITDSNFKDIVKIRKKFKKTLIKIPIKNRCEGRTWGEIKLVNGKYIYGERCKHKKMEGSNYCYIHRMKLTHGNYLKKPDKYIKYHYKKYSKINKKST